MTTDTRHTRRGQDLAGGLLVAVPFTLMSHVWLPSQPTGVEFGLGTLTAALVLLVWFRWDARAVRIPLLLAALLGLAALSLVWSDERLATGQSLIAFAALTGAALITVTHVRLPVILWALAITSVAILIASYAIALIAPHLGVTQDIYNPGTLRGIYWGRNDLSHTIALGIPAIIALPVRGIGWRIAQTAGVAFIISGIVAADTSTAIITVAVVLALAAFLLVLRTLGRRARIWVTAVVGGVAATGGTALALNWDRAFALVGRDSTFTGRTTIWENAIRVAWERPVLGFGWDAVWGGRAGEAIKATHDYPGSHPHNGFIELWLELGIVGLVLTVAILAIALVLAARSSLTAGAGVTSLWAPLMIVFVAVYDLTETYLVDYQTWLLLVMVLALALRPVGDGPIWLRRLPLVPERAAP